LYVVDDGGDNGEEDGGSVGRVLNEAIVANTITTPHGDTPKEVVAVVRIAYL
jgi:hypothetical protein